MDHILLHIGYPKAGSTYLQKWFAAHPQLLYTSDGIGGFSNTHGIRKFATCRSEPPPKYYVTSDENLASGWVAPQNQLDLQTYLDAYKTLVKQSQARVCAVLHDLLPTAHVLIVTRGCVSILRSGYSEYLKDGGTLTFPIFLQANLTAFHDWLDYDYVIDLYAQTFGSERLLVLPYELLRDDARRFLGVIEEWLGLDHYEFSTARVNPSLLPDELFWHPRISGWVATVMRIFGGRYGGKLYNRYVARVVWTGRLRRLIRLLNKLDAAPAMADEFPTELLDAFRNRATRLKDYPYYAPYAVDYLWDA